MASAESRVRKVGREELLVNIHPSVKLTSFEEGRPRPFSFGSAEITHTGWGG
jgi:hypothetical protein